MGMDGDAVRSIFWNSAWLCESGWNGKHCRLAFSASSTDLHSSQKRFPSSVSPTRMFLSMELYGSERAESLCVNVLEHIQRANQFYLCLMMIMRRTKCTLAHLGEHHGKEEERKNFPQPSGARKKVKNCNCFLLFIIWTLSPTPIFSFNNFSVNPASVASRMFSVLLLRNAKHLITLKLPSWCRRWKFLISR